VKGQQKGGGKIKPAVSMAKYKRVESRGEGEITEEKFDKFSKI